MATQPLGQFDTGNPQGTRPDAWSSFFPSYQGPGMSGTPGAQNPPVGGSTPPSADGTTPVGGQAPGQAPAPTGGYTGQPMPYQPIVPPPVAGNNEPQMPGAPPTGTGQFGQDLQGTIGSLLNSAGAPDQRVITGQVDQARGALDQTRKSQLASDQADLADRGLLGSGAEGNALGTLDKNMSQNFGSALSGIYSNEANNANQRMMTALTTGTGMSEADAQRAVDAYNAQTGRGGTLGELGLQGQAIGSQSQLGNRGLDVTTALGNQANATTSQLGNKGLDIQSLLGQGALSNQSQLGNKGLDIQSQLGNSGLQLQNLLGSGDLTLRKELGEGQLGLGEQGLNEDYSKYLGGLGLDRDKLAAATQSAQGGDLSSILQMILGGNAAGNQGYF